MFGKEAEEYAESIIGDWNYKFSDEIEYKIKQIYQEGAEFGYNKANEWHYVKDGDLPRQYENTCFSIDVLANDKRWVYYLFTNGKWFCGDKEVKNCRLERNSTSRTKGE